MLKEYVSPSHITQYKWCPKRFYYLRMGFPTIATDTYRRDLGLDIHKAIRDFYELLEKPTKEEIKKKAEECFEAYKIPKKFLQNFLKFEYSRLSGWRSYKPTFVEKPLTAKVWEDLPPLHGVIDFYSQEEKTVIDWKTGGGDNIDLIQGKTYELILKRQGYPVERVLFVNLRTGMIQQLPMVTEGFIRKEIEMFIDAVSNNHFPKREGSWCDNCEFLLRCELEGECFWRW